ncbi:MAG: PUA domain-containing protein [Candidatus Thorarchaeota archaeon]
MIPELVEPITWTEIKNQIDGDFGKGVTQKILGNLVPVMLVRGESQSFYLIPGDWLRSMNMGFEGFTLSSLGIWMGDMSDGRFRLSISILENIARFTDRHLVVSKRGAESFTYGRSILRESVVSISPRLKRRQRVIVKDTQGNCIGLGALSVDAARIDRLGPEKLVAKNLVDIGWYIRRLG